jgi:hypothetical protein
VSRLTLAHGARPTLEPRIGSDLGPAFERLPNEALAGAILIDEVHDTIPLGGILPAFVSGVALPALRCTHAALPVRGRRLKKPDV